MFPDKGHEVQRGFYVLWPRLNDFRKQQQQKPAPHVPALAAGVINILKLKCLVGKSIEQNSGIMYRRVKNPAAQSDELKGNQCSVQT